MKKSERERQEAITDGVTQLIEGFMDAIDRWDGWLAEGKVAETRANMKHLKVMMSITVLQTMFEESKK